MTDVKSGYSGGEAKTATYDQVSDGDTGHAESVQVTFDTTKVTYVQLLTVFFSVAHDPTQLNRQGNDIGTSYRTAIFYHSEEQKRIAEQVIAEITAEGIYDLPIVTEVTAFDKFWPAENYHQEYFANNPNQPYCSAVVAPKVAKFRQKFVNRLKR